MQSPLPPQTQKPLYQPTPQDKLTGKRFRNAVIITVLFIALSNGYKFLENAYAMFTSRTGELFNLEVNEPTFKGYTIMTILFFISVLFISFQQ